ncbi:MAG: iron-containing alcohol dehydrogenase [Clostridia bacterium]|nr:iron-containing alcohol dehydrogenase [Clostridia bacterium]
MNIFRRIGCRIYQRIFYVAMFFLPWRKADVLQGEGSLMQLPEVMKKNGAKSVLVVTDKVLNETLKLVPPLTEKLRELGLNVAVFDEVVPNPTIGCIEDGVKMYLENNCDCIVAFGGGSPMDCAKAIGARIARPKKSIPQMKGVLKVLKKLPPLYAIPTTAGTGSEVTLAAVISNPETNEKYPVNDPQLIPPYVVLDPSLTVGLPPHITSTTGMDALTHAVEAYIGSSNTRQTKRDAIEATQLIFKYLERAYQNGNDIEARNKMQYAAMIAGRAFTRAYVGYVHAIAHALGGFYHIPHGLANSIILPHVLRAFGPSAHKKLAQLATAVGIEGDRKTRALAFIQAIEDMNARMNIPNKIEGRYEIKTEDIPTIAKRADAEANPLYPVPKLMNAKELAEIVENLR